MYTRRDFTKLALVALPAAHVLSAPVFAFQGKPNSKVRGVMIGMNVPYNFGGRTAPVDEIIQKCVQLGVSGLELRTQPVEAALGLAAGADANAWRTSVSMDRVKEVRRKFNDAGILIEIVKVDGIFTMPDAIVDYEFNLAKNLGARAISTEIAKDLAETKRLGAFADRHKLLIAYHGHATTTPEQFETALGYARYNGTNLDLGHFVAGNHGSPIPFLQKHHERISHVHVKDRKKDNGPNVPFGQGDTPIKEVLQLIRDNKWPIQATIEFEYPIPEGSDRMTELAKTVEYCRAALA